MLLSIITLVAYNRIGAYAHNNEFLADLFQHGFLYRLYNLNNNLHACFLEKNRQNVGCSLMCVRALEQVIPDDTASFCRPAPLLGG